MNLNLSPHLCFNGECETAFRMYERVLGGRIETMLRYGESPLAAQVSAQHHMRIVHATLQFQNGTLTGVDVFPEEYEKPKGFFVTVSVAEMEKATSLFESLSEGGEVRLPFQSTFWSKGFGVVIDRFGVPWEVNCEQAADPT